MFHKSLSTSESRGGLVKVKFPQLHLKGCDFVCLDLGPQMCVSSKLPGEDGIFDWGIQYHIALVFKMSIHYVLNQSTILSFYCVPGV